MAKKASTTRTLQGDSRKMSIFWKRTSLTLTEAAYAVFNGPLMSTSEETIGARLERICTPELERFGLEFSVEGLTRFSNIIGCSRSVGVEIMLWMYVASHEVDYAPVVKRGKM